MHPGNSRPESTKKFPHPAPSRSADTAAVAANFGRRAAGWGDICDIWWNDKGGAPGLRPKPSRLEKRNNACLTPIDPDSSPVDWFSANFAHGLRAVMVAEAT